MGCQNNSQKLKQTKFYICQKLFLSLKTTGICITGKNGKISFLKLNLTFFCE